jgi:hypothetical protein
MEGELPCYCTGNNSVLILNSAYAHYKIFLNASTTSGELLRKLQAASLKIPVHADYQPNAYDQSIPAKPFPLPIFQ